MFCLFNCAFKRFICKINCSVYFLDAVSYTHLDVYKRQLWTIEHAASVNRCVSCYAEVIANITSCFIPTFCPIVKVASILYQPVLKRLQKPVTGKTSFLHSGHKNDLLNQSYFATSATLSSNNTGYLCAVFTKQYIIPVSYTHLDVYKRQAWKLSTNFITLSLIRVTLEFFFT